MREIKNMSVLITGGGSGIGEGTARYFAERGARVTITGRRRDKIDAVAASIGPACRAVVGDVTVQADRQAMLAAAVEHGGKLDVLVSNAANMYRQAVDSYTEDFLKEAFNTNVISGMMLSSLAVPLLEPTQGAIIFIGSVHNRRAFPGASPYATTKAAIEGLTRVMAAELGRRKIRVGCIVPGAVNTEINVRAGVFTADQAESRYAGIAKDHALGRIGSVMEIAEGIEYLVRAEWVTGVALEVDGGLGLGVSSF
ncbi:MAG: SDR family oxidoreductase [Rhodoferax sp.]|jgi:3-oxoacyl-[acyl-carrier protein] reductase|nr:SDR family oxidoreductase [Rhodoferax sp.]